MSWSRRTTRSLAHAAVLAAAALGVAAPAPVRAPGPAEAAPQVVTYPAPAKRAGDRRATLRVMTLNVAHGRGTGRHQLLTTKSQHQANLDAVAAVLARERPDVVALQEADGPSVWSGGFSHVDHLATKARFGCSVRGAHMSGLKVSYGTALLSMLALRHPLSVAFAPSPPTPTKGFVVAAVAWPGRPKLEVDVVSVHLDFSRKAVRARQVAEMIDRLKGRGRPLVVMGDFNCQWCDDEPTLRTLAEKLSLSAHRPEADDLKTFPKLNRRLDWVLISQELAFAQHRIVEDRVSDHLAVVCEIRLARR